MSFVVCKFCAIRAKSMQATSRTGRDITNAQVTNALLKANCTNSTASGNGGNAGNRTIGVANDAPAQARNRHDVGVK